jgi:dolichol-phosphate mannosyltransferase
MKGGEVKNWPIYRKIISRGADFIARLVLGINVSDPMSGFFIIKKDLFEKSRIKVKGYKILLNLLYDNKGAKIIEIPYTFKDRFRGKTKLDTKEMVNYLFDILRIRFG